MWEETGLAVIDRAEIDPARKKAGQTHIDRVSKGRASRDVPAGLTNMGGSERSPDQVIDPRSSGAMPGQMAVSIAVSVTASLVPIPVGRHS